MPRSDEPNQLEGTAASPAFVLHKEGTTVDDYRLIVRIGEGSFGEVWKADKGGFEVALKILRASMNSEETQRELKSLETLKKLHHKFLLHTERFWFHGDRLFIEMELADGGTLKERLGACQAAGRKGIPEDELLKYFTETAKALDYLHTQRPLILHRDIKPANLLLVQGCSKVADFGLLRQVAGDNSATHTQGGTFPYMAPESILSNVFSIYTDLWAFAVTYAQLRQGELPFPGMGQYQICEKVVKAPPELSDIFDPEEKKVLLKALDKDPKKRFTSCGEFVFELNRVVPWVPAVDVPGVTGGGHVERAAPLFSNTTTTDPRSPRMTEPGTTRKKSPATMPEVELSGLDAFSPTAPTVSQDEGTVINDKSNRLGKPSAEPPTRTSEPKHPAPSVPKPPTKDISVTPAPATISRTSLPPKPAPAFTPPRPKVPARGGLVLLFVAVLVMLFSGGWYFFHSDAKAEVRELIDKGKFPEALQALQETNRLWLPSPEPLRKEVEEKWLAELHKDGDKDTREILEGRKKRVGDFEKQFPQHAEIKKLRQSLEERIAGLKPVAGGKVNDYLASAATKLKADLLDECFKDLSEADQLAATPGEVQGVKKGYQELRDHLVNAVRNEIQDRKNYALALTKIKRLEKFKAANKLDWTPEIFDQLDADESLASAYQKQLGRAFELYLRLFKKGKNNLVEEHTVFFLNGIPDRKDIAGQVAIAGVDNPPYKEFRVLIQLIRAYDPDKVKQADSVGELVKILDDKDLSPEVRKHLWPALARLDEKTKAFRYEDLDALEGAFPALAAHEQVKTANAKILASVLDRKVKSERYEWLPGKVEMSKLNTWFERVSAATDDVLALKAECLVELDEPVAKVNEITFPLKADWYGFYVRALVLDKRAVKDNAKKKHAEAAKVLTDAFQGKAAFLKPRERSTSAVRMLRAAVGTLEREGKGSKKFVNNDDAKKAIEWLTLVSDLLDQAQDEKVLDDLIDLAFAGIKIGEGKYLTLANDRLEKGKFAAPVKSAGFYWLAKAYQAKGKSETEALANFKKSLDLPAPEKDDLRKLVASEAADFALQLAKADFAKSRWKEAIEHGVLCQGFAYQLKTLDLSAAARLNGNAVEIHALATLNMSGENQKGTEAHSVFDQAIKKAAEDVAQKSKNGFIAPVVVAKLEFAKEHAKYFPKDLAYLGKTVAEGEDALALALAEENAAKLEKDWWQTLRCKGMVRLADIHWILLRAREGKIDKNILMKEEVKAELKAILDLYQGARALKKYTERWNGELALDIGTAYFFLGFPTSDADRLTKARQELTQAQAKLKTNPQQPYSPSVQEEVQEARAGIEQLLGAIKSILDKNN